MDRSGAHVYTTSIPYTLPEIKNYQFQLLKMFNFGFRQQIQLDQQTFEEQYFDKADFYQIDDRLCSVKHEKKHCRPRRLNFIQIKKW